MTYEDIVKEYRKLFILLVEKAGRETGNSSYLNVEKILSDNNIKTMEECLIRNEPKFIILVCSYIVYLFCDIYGVKTIERWDEELSSIKLSEFYTMFLKSATIKFCEKYGLEPFDDPETSFKLITINNEKNNNTDKNNNDT